MKEGLANAMRKDRRKESKNYKEEQICKNVLVTLTLRVWNPWF